MLVQPVSNAVLYTYWCGRGVGLVQQTVIGTAGNVRAVAQAPGLLHGDEVAALADAGYQGVESAKRILEGYFRLSQRVWIGQARHAIASDAAHDAEARLKEQFAVKFATLNLTTWRHRDSFGDHGAPGYRWPAYSDR